MALGLLNKNDVEDFKKIMMEPLPTSFRINFSKPCLNVENLVNHINKFSKRYNKDSNVIEEIKFFNKVRAFHI